MVSFMLAIYAKILFGDKIGLLFINLLPVVQTSINKFVKKPKIFNTDEINKYVHRTARFIFSCCTTICDAISNAFFC